MKTIYGIKQWQTTTAGKRKKGSTVIYQDFYTNKESVLRKITGIMNVGVGPGNWSWISKDQTFIMANDSKTKKPFRFIFNVVKKDLYEE